jgi:4-amino-4-deoxy-L-arabinose transferase-like glycosyltransferase
VSQPSAPRFSRNLLLVIGVAAVAILLRLGAAPVERAEIYFIDAARGMVESGDWLVPRYRGQPFFDKPALVYWLIAGCFEAFGFSLGAARLVPAFSALGVLAATALLGRRLFDPTTGLRSAMVLASTLLVMSFSRVAMSDMTLTLFSTLAVLVGVEIVRRPAPTPALLAAAFGACLGLGFLTKGPIALLLPGLGLVLLLHGNGWRTPMRAGGWVVAAVAAAVLGLGWFAALYARLGREPLEWFFLRENLQRFAGSTYDAERSPLYYLGAYLAMGLPWSLLFVPAALRAPRGERFLLGWLGLMLLPLSASRGKIDYYLLPLLPAASIVIARFLGLAWSRAETWVVRAALVLLGLGVLVLPGALQRLPVYWLPGVAAHWGLTLACALSLGLVGRALRRPEGSTVLAAFAGPSLVLFTLLSATFMPVFRARQPNSAIVQDVRREIAYTPAAGLGLCQDPVRAQRDILFEARLPVVERCDLWALAAAQDPYLLLVSAEEHASLIRTPGMREVSRYDGVPATALTFEGFLAGVDPRPVYLIANFATRDPVAALKLKRERRRELGRLYAESVSLPEETPVAAPSPSPSPSVQAPGEDEVGRRRKARSGRRGSP